MKKSLSIILTALLTLTLLLSCGGKESKTETTKASTPSAKSNGVTVTVLNSKGEIQNGLEAIAKLYESETGVKVEIMACGAGEVPYTKVTTMYNSGNAPVISIIDPLDVSALARDYALDLSNEKWVAEMGNQITRLDGKVYGFPFCIEGRGIIYNKAAIENTLGRKFEPSTINTYNDFASLLNELRANGMENPVFLAKEDWSLAAHQLCYVYELADGTLETANAIADSLKNGTDPLTIESFNLFFDTLDLLLEYNVSKADPLGADYDEGALMLAEGDVAFWPNGNWAWPNLQTGGASADDEYGFLPFFLGNDITAAANNGMQAAASKMAIVDRVQATAEEQAAAKDFLNWLVFDEDGQKALVEECAIVPVAQNNPVAPIEPLGRDIVKKMGTGETIPTTFIAPSDHWSVLGAELQKYISGNQTREDFAKNFSKYWQNQK